MGEVRTAIIYGGAAYNIKFSLQSQLDNLIIPNDADVFVVVPRFCKRRRTPASDIPLASDNEAWNAKCATTIVDWSPLEDSDIQLIRDKFGDRLKVLKIADDIPDHMAEIEQDRELMRRKINDYVAESKMLKLPEPFRGIEVTSSDTGTIRCVIDQYRHVRKCYQLMEQYEKENNFQYDYVMRARIDFIVPFIFNIEHYTLNHDQPYLYCLGSFRREVFEWADEFCFFSKRSMAAKLFPELNKMGLIVNRKYQTLQYGTPYAPDGNDFMFDPECQFSLLLHELNIKVINVIIWRSACYTAGNDGWDYMNYIFSRSPLSLDYEYKLVCECETDINEHLPKLKEYAEKCDHVTEIGLRYGNSTVAFMAARPKRFISYDQQYNPKMDYLKMIAADNGINFEIRIENATPEDGVSQLEETDFLFIDSNHHATQLRSELRLHAGKVRKYIALHDTTTFWDRGAGDDHMDDGMKLAIEPFLENNLEWKMIYRAMNNNGLMILERIT